MRSERLDALGLAVSLWLLATCCAPHAPAAAHQRPGPASSAKPPEASGVVAIGWAPKPPESVVESAAGTKESEDQTDWEVQRADRLNPPGASQGEPTAPAS
jgi:hypothetical protein